MALAKTPLEEKRKFRDYQAQWYKDNRERLRVKMGEYSRTPIERYRQVRRRAGKRGIDVVVGKEDFIKWFSESEKTCHYCHLPLTNYENGAPHGLTVDRKDNAKPYELDNMVLACMRCNVMKGAWLTEEQMIDAAKRYFVEPLIGGDNAIT